MNAGYQTMKQTFKETDKQVDVWTTNSTNVITIKVLDVELHFVLGNGKQTWCMNLNKV